MNTITSKPLYELRLSAIGTIESQASLAWIGMRPPRISIDIGDSAITYGNFLNALLTFLIVAFAMFLVVKAYNRMAGPKDATTRPCPYCKTDIALDATRCPNCTSQLEGAAV